jgi:hypothetical protein
VMGLAAAGRESAAARASMRIAGKMARVKTIGTSLRLH